jgi:hypothetical protein
MNLMQRPLFTLSLMALVSGLATVACTPNETTTVAPATPDSAAETPAVTFAEVEGPDNGLADVDNGLVKQLTLSGPASAVLITCDQGGFEPFTFTDMGLDWVGCQVPNPGDAVGPESALMEPAIEDVASPVGGTVQQVTIPGPQVSIVVACADDFKPFIYEDQGTWVGCQTP